MASRPPPSFFKVLLHPSHSQLPLPSSFVSKHLGYKIPKDPIIQTNGGYIWKLKIKKIGEIYFFTNGWSSIVKEIELGFGDLLLFRLIDKSTFKLLIYSPSGCQKFLPPKVKVELDVDSVSSVDDGVCNVEDDVVDDDDDIDDDGDEEEEEEDFEDEKEDVDDSDDYEDEDEDDDVCDAADDEDVDNEDLDDDGVHIDGDDGDPFFMSTISKAHKSTLRLPTEFVGLAEIDAEKTIIVKNLDGQEWPIRLLSEKVNESERYYLSAGWAEFRRSNDLLEGDDCVFKFIASEDKLCLAKVTKKKRPIRQSRQCSEFRATEGVKRKWGGPPHEHGGNVEVESDSDHDVEGEDDGGGNIDREDDDADDVDSEDDDPSFISTMSKTHKHILRLPAEFVDLAGIKAGKTIMMKDLDNKEWPMGLRLEKKKMKQSKRYYIATGWSDFHRSNDFSEGDECVFKFIRSEGKLRLAKVTNKKRQSQPFDKILATEDDDNDGEDDCDPCFTCIISKNCHFMRLPEEFVRLSGIDGTTITVKNLDGEELRVGLKLDKSRRQMKKYMLSTKWADFLRSNDLKKGDECVFKFIINEAKLCLVKVTKNKRGRPPCKQGDEVDVESENDSMEFMERPCGDDDEDDDDGEHDNGNDNIEGEDEVDGGGDINGDDGDPFFTMVISKSRTLRLPKEFVGLPGIEDGNTMTVKNLEGEEQQLGLRVEKRFKNADRYLLSTGWVRFVESNKLMYGDECVFKFIRSEGKLCLAKVTNKKRPSTKDDGVDVENDDNRSSGDDDNDEDENDNDDGDPFVKFTITKGYSWRLPKEFIGLPGIEGGKSITVKNLEGKEKSLGLLLDKSCRNTERYILSAGWVPFLRSNNLSEGDACVIKFIRNEGKFFVTKVTKNKRQTRKRQSAGGIPVAKVVKRMRRQPQSPVGISVTEAVDRKRGRSLRNGVDVEVVKRPPGRRAKR